MDEKTPTLEEILDLACVKGIKVVLMGNGWYGRRYKIEVCSYGDIGPCKTLEELRIAFKNKHGWMLNCLPYNEDD